jgi:hypothetical protein
MGIQESGKILQWEHLEDWSVGYQRSICLKGFRILC